MGMAASFEKSKKTFLGFLQARGKALNTVKNYGHDLSELGQYCERHGLDYKRLGLAELDSYHRELSERGLKVNSRRRKLMTAKSFLRYLSGRSDVSTAGSEKIVPPEKNERPPRLVPRASVLAIAESQPDTDIGLRNRALISTLLDTGMLVTEALTLRKQDCSYDKEGATLSIGGKRARSVRVGMATAAALLELSKRLPDVRYFFYGYTRSGPNAERLTARGVEVLFKAWAKFHRLPHLHPRTLRHIFVVESLLAGRSEAEVMAALALRTPYAFRVYRPLVEKARSPEKA